MRKGPDRSDIPVVVEGLAPDGQKVSATDGTSPYHSLTGPKRVTTPSAADILTVCKERSLVETAKLLFEARTHLEECSHQEPVEGSSFQISKMVVLPNKGTAYFMSDIEGRGDLVAKLIDDERLIERWQKNDPNDQVFLCILGDIIDRSTSSSSLVDLLLELKCRYGFSRNIVVLSGNHELTPFVQKEDKLGLYREVTKRREFPSLREEVDDPITQELIEIKVSSEMCNGDTQVSLPANPSGRLEFAREGLWQLYNEVFSLFPTSLVTPHGAYVAHAGFPVRGNFKGLYGEAPRTEDENHDYLLALARYADAPSSRAVGETTVDITWSDLNPALDEHGCADMFRPNMKRGKGGKPGPGVEFGLKGFETFASIGKFTLFLRGHQAQVPAHPSVQIRNSTTWSYGPILTIANGMLGGYAVLDLAIKNPTPESVRIGEIQEQCELEF
jgi:hypothetical protein